MVNLEFASVTAFVGLAALIVASVSDIKTREVPDWLNFCLIAFVIGNSLILAIFFSSFGILLDTLAGLAIGLAIGLTMFYTGQWGGGDSKLIIGLSGLIGFGVSSFGLQEIATSQLIIFFVNTLFVGAVYGVGYSLFMALMNFKACKEEANKILVKKVAIAARIFLSLLVLSAFAYWAVTRASGSILLFLLALLLLILFYMWILVSTVEKVCMIRKVKVKTLTEGDWVVEPVMKEKRLILKPTKIGLTKQDLKKLAKNNIRTVVIKTGIPFVPSFLIAFLLTISFGNWLAYLL